MDSTETRLRRAAAETREAASHSVPPGLGQERTGGSGWLVLATAFAAVLVVFAIPALLGGEPAPVAEPVSEPPTTVVEVAPTTTPPEDLQSCSSAGVSQPQLPADLPAEVADKAKAIMRFAATCDFDGLADIAGPGFITSFGGGGVDNLGQWEEEGRGELDTLIKLFGTSHAVTDILDGPDIYVWPAAFAYDRWEDIPEEYLEELSSIYSKEELDEIAAFGSYAGWRIGIDENGEWLSFIAGD